jgi:elongator complex protein 5
MLSSVLDSSLRPSRPLVVLQSSSAQSCLQLLRVIAKEDSGHHTTVMCCLVHPPSTFIAEDDHTVVVDRTGFVPGYDDASHGHSHALLDAVRNGESATFGLPAAD